ncbi:hypothetical protein [Paludibacterium denitrificans]|uniref:PAS domain-containing protein n=1 Tax=Paludibacterium denitrificans TaxID=2675226 RepID=A0A844GEE1_9NEIS|nr:hypothetical protein [Paludibacterium denitrificans]MTD33588.1 hypothetical protein [Paludibacterium denitrificans]
MKVAQQQADEAIFFQSERAAVTLNAIHDGVITLRQDQTIEMINPMALALVGLLNQRRGWARLSGCVPPVE